MVHPTYFEAAYFAKAGVYYQGFQVGLLESGSFPGTYVVWLFSHPCGASQVKHKGSSSFGGAAWKDAFLFPREAAGFSLHKEEEK